MFGWEYYLWGIILLPGLLFAIYASVRVNRSYAKYSKVKTQAGLTGAEVAAQMLKDAGAYDVGIVRTGGHLTDHYDPRSKTLALSESVYSGTSVAAIGIAAHEVGHAIQHDTEYFPLKIRSALVPVVNISSRMLWPVIMIGLFFSFLVENTLFGELFILAGIIMFGAALVLSLVTLPVEFDASRRAFRTLYDKGPLTREEAVQSKKVLNAAALTYVAAMLVSLLQLLRFLLVAASRRRR